MIDDMHPERVETGYYVFFYGKGIVERTIRFGSRVKYWWKYKEWLPYDQVPHHIEIIERDEDGVLSWGAHHSAGFINKPLVVRVGSLAYGKDYDIVAHNTTGYRRNISHKLREMHGDSYEDYYRVGRTWRNGNRKLTDAKFCSEAGLIIASLMYFWARREDRENITPLRLRQYLINYGGEVMETWALN